MTPRRCRSERLLVWLLRAVGLVVACALLATLLPRSWMAAAHAGLGLGDFPAAPLSDYLTRSVALLYAIHGGLLLVLSTDVRRYAPVVAYVAVSGMAFGAAMVVIDAYAGMPWWWTLGEGPPVLLTNIAVLFLLRGVQRSRP